MEKLGGMVCAWNPSAGKMEADPGTHRLGSLAKLGSSHSQKARWTPEEWHVRLTFDLVHLHTHVHPPTRKHVLSQQKKITHSTYICRGLGLQPWQKLDPGLVLDLWGRVQPR